MVRVRNTLYSASGNLLAKQPERSMRVCVCVFMDLPLAKQGNLVGGKKCCGFVLFCFFKQPVRIVGKPDVT